MRQASPFLSALLAIPLVQMLTSGMTIRVAFRRVLLAATAGGVAAFAVAHLTDRISQCRSANQQLA